MLKTVAALGAAVLALTVAEAPAADFYAGKTVKIVAGTAPGGGYDTHARLIAQFLGRHIPGNPNVIVQNMPAGGGMAATNHVFAIAERDGTEIGLFNRNTLFAPMLGQDLAKYKAEQFNWIGTPASYSDNAYTFFIQSKMPYKTFDEMRKANPPINVGNIGSVVIRVLNEALGVPMKLIGGYTGSQLDLAFERGEIDGAGSSYANLLNSHQDWIDKPLLRFMVQFGSGKRIPALADVPTARELATKDDDRQLVEFSEQPLTLGYPVAAPPGVPAERVAILRAAFKAVMEDPDYRAAGQKVKMEYSPKLGQVLQDDILRVSKTPASVTERYKKLADMEAGGK
jgi:tripartite-type tricarboxylate transporter receptor subunit TctC